MDKSQQSVTNNQHSDNLFKSNVELSQQNQNSQADKYEKFFPINFSYFSLMNIFRYAVLADINSISTSIFDSLGSRTTTMIEKDDNKNKTPTPPPATVMQQRNYATGNLMV